MAHHKDVNLCDPYEDPESWYQAREVWEKRSSFSQAVFNFNNTLFGRMLIGPLIGMTGFIKSDCIICAQASAISAGNGCCIYSTGALLGLVWRLRAAAGLGCVAGGLYRNVAFDGADLFWSIRPMKRFAGAALSSKMAGCSLFSFSTIRCMQFIMPIRPWPGTDCRGFSPKTVSGFLKLNDGYSLKPIVPCSNGIFSDARSRYPIRSI